VNNFNLFNAKTKYEYIVCRHYARSVSVKRWLYYQIIRLFCHFSTFGILSCNRNTKRRYTSFKMCVWTVLIGKILGSHGGEYEDDYLLRCCTFVKETVKHLRKVDQLERRWLLLMWNVISVCTLKLISSAYYVSHRHTDWQRVAPQHHNPRTATHEGRSLLYWHSYSMFQIA
jgi:hypothetical protein